MRRFIHGGDIYSYQEDIIDFSANINPLGMPESVRREAIKSIGYCENYPDPFCRRLILAISSYEGITADSIVCGNGAADLIHRIIYALKPRKALVLAPSFSEYERAFLSTGCRVTHYTLLKEKDFMIQEDILESIAGDMDMVVVCNPNNPTGAVTERRVMRRIHEKVKATGAVLVADECFMDFLEDCEDYTMKNYIDNNLIIIKAFTKLFAMPGIRLGYLLANKGNAEAVRLTGQAWPVSLTAQMCGVKALSEKEYISDTRRVIGDLRERLSGGLTELGFEVFSGRANYILFKTDILNLHKILLGKNILIRDCSNFIGLEKGFFRIAVKSEKDNSILLKALEEIVRS